MGKQIETELLIIGGGAAGLCAAIEAAEAGVQVTLAESDLHIGGQLVKQTHKFFGSEKEYAGTRGLQIAEFLLKEIEKYKTQIRILFNTMINGYYPEEDVFTAMRGEEEFYWIKAKRCIVATGAQEKILPFTNNDLPGVYGAGAVQTLANVYGVLPGKRVLMVGAGNIGLIVSYQLRQAGVEIAGIVEAAPRVGGYWVHAAKIRRLGIPIYLCHTVVRAVGTEKVEGAYIREVNEKFEPVGEEKFVECDVICMAVGLSPSTELLWQSECKMEYVPELCGHVPYRDKEMRTTNLRFWVAGDAAGIEEASSAMIEGRIAGWSAAKSLGKEMKTDRFDEYQRRLSALRSGEAGTKIRAGLEKVFLEEGE
jgi:sarcosine oxidase subunit alpha